MAEFLILSTTMAYYSRCTIMMDLTEPEFKYCFYVAMSDYARIAT